MASRSSASSSKSSSKSSSSSSSSSSSVASTSNSKRTSTKQTSSSQQPREPRERGDKIFVGGSPEDRKVLIRDIIECIRMKGPKSLLITVSDLSEFLHKQSPLSPSNLFRKQYGNLEHVFSYEKLTSIFYIENSVIRLQPLATLESAVASNLLSAELLTECEELHRGKRIHDLTTWKTVGKNECKRCHTAYSVLANTMNACSTNSSNHVPSFDFEKSDDVLRCTI